MLSLKETVISEEDLTEVIYTQYTFDEAIQRLLAGDILLISKLEKSRNADVLVQLERSSKAPHTQISYEVNKPKGAYKERYWFNFDLPINAFSFYKVYAFNDIVNEMDIPLRVGDKIEYTSRDEVKDLAYITKVLKDEENNVYFKVSRDTGVYQIDELKPLQ